MTDPAEAPPCRAVKHGNITLMCELSTGHEGWHRAEYHARQEATYQGAHHVISTAECVTWEPVDHAREAVRHLMTARPTGGDPS